MPFEDGCDLEKALEKLSRAISLPLCWVWVAYVEVQEPDQNQGSRNALCRALLKVEEVQQLHALALRLCRRAPEVEGIALANAYSCEISIGPPKQHLLRAPWMWALALGTPPALYMAMKRQKSVLAGPSFKPRHEGGSKHLEPLLWALFLGTPPPKHSRRTPLLWA
jgi:hypothetical protein